MRKQRRVKEYLTPSPGDLTDSRSAPVGRTGEGRVGDRRTGPAERSCDLGSVTRVVNSGVGCRVLSGEGRGVESLAAASESVVASGQGQGGSRNDARSCAAGTRPTRAAASRYLPGGDSCSVWRVLAHIIVGAPHRRLARWNREGRPPADSQSRNLPRRGKVARRIPAQKTCVARGPFRQLNPKS